MEELVRTAVTILAGVVYAVLASLVVGKPVAGIVVVLHGSYQITPSWGQPSLAWSGQIALLLRLHQLEVEYSWTEFGVVMRGLLCAQLKRVELAVAPDSVLGGVALVASFAVLWGLRVNLYHSRYSSEVHLNSMKNWRVNAVGSPKHNKPYPQALAVGTIALS